MKLRHFIATAFKNNACTKGTWTKGCCTNGDFYHVEMLKLFLPFLLLEIYHVEMFALCFVGGKIGQMLREMFVMNKFYQKKSPGNSPILTRHYLKKGHKGPTPEPSQLDVPSSTSGLLKGIGYKTSTGDFTTIKAAT